MNGVSFGDKHSYTDYGLILSEKHISFPKPQTTTIQVPGRSGSLDFSEVPTGDIEYEDRTITLTFSMIDKISTWEAKKSEIANYLHGKRLKIIFDDDPLFYYIGRLAINEFTSDRTIGKLVIDATVDPYKYEITSSAEDWLWDSFDFEEGIINEGNTSVNGTATVVITARRKKTYPTIIVSADMTVTYDGVTYNLKAGKNVIYDILLAEGENELIFTGNGTVSVDYRGGSL